MGRNDFLDEIEFTDQAFVETHWFTATAEENGETRHNGFDVYILYDCPFGTGE